MRCTLKRISFFFQAEDGIRDSSVTGVQTCALPILGTVDSVGRDVTTIAVGDEVNVIPSFSMNQYGMYGEVVLAPIHAVVKHPNRLSPVEAASIWMMFVTAYGALIEDATIPSEDAVLSPDASSSVGLA